MPPLNKPTDNIDVIKITFYLCAYTPNFDIILLNRDEIILSDILRIEVTFTLSQGYRQPGIIYNRKKLQYF